jgi:hypothetical protein
VHNGGFGNTLNKRNPVLWAAVLSLAAVRA